MTPDASIVTGNTIDGGNLESLVVDATHGLRNLRQVLATDHGFAEEFTTVRDISRDAKTLLLIREGNSSGPYTLISRW